MPLISKTGNIDNYDITFSTGKAESVYLYIDLADLGTTSQIDLAFYIKEDSLLLMRLG